MKTLTAGQAEDLARTLSLNTNIMTKWLKICSMLFCALLLAATWYGSQVLERIAQMETKLSRQAYLSALVYDGFAEARSLSANTGIVPGGLASTPVYNTDPVVQNTIANARVSRREYLDALCHVMDSDPVLQESGPIPDAVKAAAYAALLEPAFLKSGEFPIISVFVLLQCRNQFRYQIIHSKYFPVDPVSRFPGTDLKSLIGRRDMFRTIFEAASPEAVQQICRRLDPKVSGTYPLKLRTNAPKWVEAALAKIGGSM